jgi:hypothetical protein
MSTTPPQEHQRHTTVKTTSTDNQEVKLVQHSQLFYWWPVWAIGFVLGIITLLGNHRAALVPADTTIEKKASGEGYTIDVKHATSTLDKAVEAKHFHIHMVDSQFFGVLFCLTLLVVIVITNVPLRGMWSIVVIVSGLLLLLCIWSFGWLEELVGWFILLDIHINAAGYLFISLVLFIMWAVSVFLFDQQIYATFTSGQLRVRETIGSGETAYDTSGMVIQRQNDDLFRHKILGLGSGDLIVRTSGAHSHEFRLNNVLFVNRKLHLIEEMQRDRPVVAG